MPAPELVAHRGYAARRPENTLVALAAALAAGARYVEVDVQITRDGVPVLFHDRTLSRMCGVDGAIHERTFDELRALSCGEAGRFGDRFASERIASLNGLVDLLLRYPKAFAFVEIKRAAIERFGTADVLGRVMPLVEPVRDRSALISFDLPFLAAARRSQPVALGAVFDHWREREAPMVREIAPEFVFCDVDGLPRDGPLSHGAARIAVYEVADPRLALSLGERGVHLVETFEIAEMLAALRGIA